MGGKIKNYNADPETLEDYDLTRLAGILTQNRESRKKQIDDAIQDGSIVEKFELFKYEADESMRLYEVVSEIQIRRQRKKDEESV